MKTLIQKYTPQTVIFMFLLVPVLNIQAQAAKISIAPTEQTHAMITAGSMLQHNRHLLHNTTIGEGLKASSDQYVKNLYQQAYNVFLEAADAYSSGQEARAKELAQKSINIFYVADKAHYGIPEIY